MSLLLAHGRPDPSGVHQVRLLGVLRPSRSVSRESPSSVSLLFVGPGRNTTIISPTVPSNPGTDVSAGPDGLDYITKTSSQLMDRLREIVASVPHDAAAVASLNAARWLVFQHRAAAGGAGRLPRLAIDPGVMV